MTLSGIAIGQITIKNNERVSGGMPAGKLENVGDKQISRK